MGAARAKRQNIVMLLKRQRGPMPTAKSGDWRGFGEDLDPLWPVASENSILSFPNSRVERTDGAGRQGSDGQQRLRSVRSSASRGRPSRAKQGPHLIIIGGVFHKES